MLPNPRELDPLVEPRAGAAAPKYALLEIERRWLVEVEAREVAPLEGRPHREIDDLYIAGTRLRLRKVAGEGSEPVFKLGKKYGKATALAEPITNLYLTQAEYDALARLPGARVRKRRYALGGGSLDVYEGPHAGLAVFEVQFDSEEAAAAYTPPGFVRAEVTREPRYSGASLAGRTAGSPDRIASTAESAG